MLVTGSRALRPLLLLASALLLQPVQSSPAAESGDLASLRSQALALVNAARREQGRAQLTLGDTLNEAAQDHAEDMLARDYYSHVSPEGEDARDRYLARGGDRHELVAENIASCVPCGEVPRAHHVEQMHRRWMDSPHHRENVLRAGVTRFGFGIVAGKDGSLYAVQTFAGPGSPRGDATAAGDGGAAAGEATAPLEAAEADDAFVRALNARRAARSRPAIEVSEALSTTAAGMLPDAAAEEVTIGRGALAGETGRDWASLWALAGSCSGCGAEIVAADIDHFIDMWLQEPAYAERLLGPDQTSAGFALRAFGDGRKVAVAVLGRRW